MALLVAGPGQLVYIEHPESHLNAEMQAALAQLLADTAGGGVKALIETYSGSLLRKVQDMAEEGQVAPGIAQIYCFEKRDNGTTVVTC